MLGIAYAAHRKMFDPKFAALGCAAFFRQHPEELLRLVRQARHLRFGIPVAALRWLLLQFQGATGPRDIELEVAPPGLRVSATVEEMETTLRGSAVVTVHQVQLSSHEFRVEVRLADLSVSLVDERARTPLAALIRSGALDLSRAADLIAHMPSRPAALVEATDNRIVLDLMRFPLLARDERLRRIIGAIATVLSVESVETDPSHLDVALRAIPGGLRALLSRQSGTPRRG